MNVTETVAQRVSRAMKARGMNENQLERAAFGEESSGRVNNFISRNTANPHRKTTLALARALDVSFVWLSTGQGSPEAPDRGDDEPAASDIVSSKPGSGPRRRGAREEEPTPVPLAVRPAEHAYPDEVEELMQDVLRRPGQKKAKGKSITAAKVFFVGANMKINENKREDLLAKALEAAEELVDDGIDPTPSAITGRLFEHAAATQTPAERGRHEQHQRAHEANVDQLRREREQEPQAPAAPRTKGLPAGARSPKARR